MLISFCPWYVRELVLLPCSDTTITFLVTMLSTTTTTTNINNDSDNSAKWATSPFPCGIQLVQQVDPRPKELFSPMPVVHLLPEQDRETPQTGIYRCPVYKVRYLIHLDARQTHSHKHSHRCCCPRLSQTHKSDHHRHHVETLSVYGIFPSSTVRTNTRPGLLRNCELYRQRGACTLFRKAFGLLKQRY